jgi:hypothetical protein
MIWVSGIDWGGRVEEMLGGITQQTEAQQVKHKLILKHSSALCSIHNLSLTTRLFLQRHGMDPNKDGIGTLAVSEGVFDEAYIPICGC